MDTYGTLSVRLLAGPMRTPLSEATVAVTQKTPCGKYTVLSVQATGADGAIVPISVSVPASGGPAVCDIWADHPDYKMQVAEEQSVDAGRETCLELELEPDD